MTASRASVDPPPFAAAPADLVERALSPLVVNAVQHARTAVVVTIVEHGRVLEVQVDDDGPGMVGSDLDGLFTAGVREPASHGAGLGLALSRRVAQTLGGDVEVTSAVDPTRFTLTLPRF